MRVTLSYFIDPSPGARGWTTRYGYESHGLRFAVRNQLETPTRSNNGSTGLFVKKIMNLRVFATLAGNLVAGAPLYRWDLFIPTFGADMPSILHRGDISGLPDDGLVE